MDPVPGPTWTVGNELRKARKDAGLEQADIAKVAGVARQTVSNWENDKGEPTITQWRKIMKATGNSYLFTYPPNAVTLRDVSDLRLPLDFGSSPRRRRTDIPLTVA